jgi:hypothetical protein
MKYIRKVDSYFTLLLEKVEQNRFLDRKAFWINLYKNRMVGENGLLYRGIKQLGMVALRVCFLAYVTVSFQG